MNRLTKIISGFFVNNKNDYTEPKITRNQARKVLIDFITPKLLTEGFMHQKNLRFWRITGNKTDVIELRFLLNSSPATSNLPESTFSILGGCYFNFIPNIFDEKLIQEIPNVVSPDEAHCHLRFTAKANTKQSAFKNSTEWWHLDCNEIEKAQVLSDVEFALKERLIPLMDKYENLNNLLRLLESEELDDSNIGIGSPDSLNRQYFLSFLLLKLNEKKKAVQYLNRSKELLDDLLMRVKNPMGLQTGTPLLKQSEHINNAISFLDGKQS